MEILEYKYVKVVLKYSLKVTVPDWAHLDFASAAAWQRTGPPRWLRATLLLQLDWRATFSHNMSSLCRQEGAKWRTTPTNDAWYLGRQTAGCCCDLPTFKSSHTTKVSLWLTVSVVSSMPPCLLMSWNQWNTVPWALLPRQRRLIPPPLRWLAVAKLLLHLFF